MMSDKSVSNKSLECVPGDCLAGLIEIFDLPFINAILNEFTDIGYTALHYFCQVVHSFRKPNFLCFAIELLLKGIEIITTFEFLN